VKEPIMQSGGDGGSVNTDTTWRYSVFGPDRLGKGAVLFTGPDGIRDHRVQVEEEHRYVGGEQTRQKELVKWTIYGELHEVYLIQDQKLLA